MNLAGRIHRLVGASLVSAVASVLLPRWVPWGGEGLAAAAGAALTFLALFGSALALALVALVSCVRHWSKLPATARAAGVVPALLLGAALGYLLLMLRE